MVRPLRDPTSTGAPSRSPRSPWWTQRAVRLHLALALSLPVFGLAFVWQVERVRQGNELSWAYVFEWPFFAGYAVYLWWKLLHGQLGDQSGSGEAAQPAGPGAAQPGTPALAGAPEMARTPAAAREEEELAAYNRYLATLSSSGRRRRR